MQKQREEADRLKARIAELEEDRKQNDPRDQIHSLTLRLQQEQSENAALKKDVQRLRARIVELEETVEQNDPQNETHMLTLQLQQEQSENATLREDMQRQREEADGLKTRIAELEKEVKEKDAKVS